MRYGLILLIKSYVVAYTNIYFTRVIVDLNVHIAVAKAKLQNFHSTDIKIFLVEHQSRIESIYPIMWQPL